MSNAFEILKPYEQLDEALIGGDSRIFLSDWNGDHPFVRQYLGELAERPYFEWGSLTQYSAMQYDEDLKEKIARFHTIRDGVAVSATSVYPSAGSAGFLSTVSMWLREEFPDELLYIPPLYYNHAWWMQRLGSNPVCVASRHADDPSLVLDLPDRRTVLTLTDPVWYAGRRVAAAVVEQLRIWQERTGSLIFVDGTFQYLGWDDEPRGELMAGLLPDQTLRLICPTKALGMHGCRFAYLLAPPALITTIGELHANLHGPASLSDRVFAHRAMDVLSSPRGNRDLLQHGQRAYRRLVDSDALDGYVVPETGYFLFARPKADPTTFLAMDETFYELTGSPGYVRINLAKPAAVEFLLTAGAT